MPMNTYEVEIENIKQQRDQLLAVAKEIASDSRCDLVDSERRIRLYAAIQNADGKR